MAYQRHWNAKWVEGVECDYFDRFDRRRNNPKLVTIKRISGKLGHATVDVPLHDGTTKERKFGLGHLEYANEIDSSGSHYSAHIVIRTPEYLKQREDEAALKAQQQRQRDVIDKLVDKTKYYVLNDSQLEQLESMVRAIEAMQNKG